MSEHVTGGQGLQPPEKKQKTIVVGVGIAVALVLGGLGLTKVLSMQRCSKLSEEVAAASASALGDGATAETILAAREAAEAKAKAAGLGTVTVEAAIERRTSPQLQVTVHLVIEVHAGDCHAAYERPLDSPPTGEDMQLLAEQGVKSRSAGVKGHH